MSRRCMSLAHESDSSIVSHKQLIIRRRSCKILRIQCSCVNKKCVFTESPSFQIWITSHRIFCAGLVVTRKNKDYAERSVGLPLKKTGYHSRYLCCCCMLLMREKVYTTQSPQYTSINPSVRVSPLMIPFNQFSSVTSVKRALNIKQLLKTITPHVTLKFLPLLPP